MGFLQRLVQASLDAANEATRKTALVSRTVRTWPKTDDLASAMSLYRYQLPDLPADGDEEGFEHIDVAGTHHYQAEIENIAGMGPNGPLRNHLVAILLPEPWNEYDPDAIRVVVEGRHVGYVPRAETDWWLERIECELADDEVLAGHAIVVGGGTHPQTNKPPSLGMYLLIPDEQ